MKEYFSKGSRENDINRRQFSFNEILNILTKEELLKHLQWFQSQVEFAMQIVEKYDDTNINRKKKVASILEEL